MKLTYRITGEMLGASLRNALLATAKSSLAQHHDWSASGQTSSDTPTEGEMLSLRKTRPGIISRREHRSANSAGRKRINR